MAHGQYKKKLTRPEGLRKRNTSNDYSVDYDPCFGNPSRRHLRLLRWRVECEKLKKNSHSWSSRQWPIPSRSSFVLGYFGYCQNPFTRLKFGLAMRSENIC